jgi:hypothetical protein
MLSIQFEQLDQQRKLNEKQTVVLELQANELKESREEREREAEQRKKAQAAKVFVKQANSVYIPDDLSEISETFDETDAWTDITKAEAEGGWQVAEITVVNTSDQPVYDPKLRWHRGSTGHGFPNPEPIETIMPSGEIKRVRRFPLDTNMDVSGAILMFRDAAGVRWIRRPDGGLAEQQ